MVTAPNAHVNGGSSHDQPSSSPALPGDVYVQGHAAGLDQPEAAGVTAVFEKPVPGRKLDVAGGLREHGELVTGHAVQERMNGKRRRRHFGHSHHHLSQPQPGPAAAVRPVLKVTPPR
jgi:hypothetical protein